MENITKSVYLGLTEGQPAFIFVLPLDQFFKKQKWILYSLGLILKLRMEVIVRVYKVA